MPARDYICIRLYMQTSNPAWSLCFNDTVVLSCLVHLECPSCRKEVTLGKEKLNILPRNLALENIVFRYTEERSKSIRKSLILESTTSGQTSPANNVLLQPLSTTQIVPKPSSSSSAGHDNPESEVVTCDICSGCGEGEEVADVAAVAVVADSSVAAAAGGLSYAAEWYCSQCQVAYCPSCFAKYHPKKGALAKHKVREMLVHISHSQMQWPNKSAYIFSLFNSSFQCSGFKDHA